MNTVEIKTPQSTHQVLEEKLTSLGLYVTAREAYETWQADPEQIKVLDVRTFEEYVLIGHAEMAVNIPLAFPSYKWDVGKGNYSIVVNTDFIAHVKERFTSDDTILVMCRSGGRSAMAVNALAKAGFAKVHNIEVNAWDIAKSLIVTMLIPIVLGLMLRSHSPEDAQQWAPLILIPTARGLGKRNSA